MAESHLLAPGVETEPDPANVRLLQERLYEFNTRAAGIADGELFGLFLRAADGAVIGGAYGWSWGGTCHLRYLFIPDDMRRQGHGTRLMAAVEKEARARCCVQIVLETHDFQAPEFYRKLAFEIAGVVQDYPRGHRLLTMVKRLSAPATG